MGKLYLFIAVGLAVVVVGGAAFLAAWDIPAPTDRVEKVLPNDRFPK